MLSVRVRETEEGTEDRAMSSNVMFLGDRGRGGRRFEMSVE
jgi:hypothetical protein